MQDQKAFDGFDVSVDNKAKLEAKFIIPPFSVLDARQGYWQARKRLWASLGIKSELGRDDNALGHPDTTINISFYAQKRALEKELDKPLTTQEATDILGERGAIRLINQSSLARNKGGLTFKGSVASFDHYRVKEGSREHSDIQGTSIFDPVLCELIYKWFCPEGGHILDPFAGGSARGIVASVVGKAYTGIDLSQRQIEANKEQATEITPDKPPEWITGDSYELDSLLPPNKHYDLIFSCPPYHDLEQYTDDPGDLSNMSWSSFKERYREIIAKCILKLNNNRFACFVVSEIRDNTGGYKGLVPYTINCFTQGGARYYNEMILVNVIGSLPVRIVGQFGYRKIGRTHQNVLVFYKGDMSLIPKFFKDIDTSFNYGSNGEASP